MDCDACDDCSDGEYYARKGDFGDACLSYTQAVGGEIKHACALEHLGTVYILEAYHGVGELGGYRSAICEYDKAIEFEPEVDYLYFYRGFAYYARGNFGENFNAAIADFDRAIYLNPRDNMSYGCRGLFITN